MNSPAILFFPLIEIQLMYHTRFISGVLHNDLTLANITKWSPSVSLQSYYTTIDHIPYTVYYITVACLLCHWRFVCLNPLYLFRPLLVSLFLLAKKKKKKWSQPKVPSVVGCINNKCNESKTDLSYMWINLTKMLCERSQTANNAYCMNYIYNSKAGNTEGSGHLGE